MKTTFKKNGVVYKLHRITGPTATAVGCNGCAFFIRGEGCQTLDDGPACRHGRINYIFKESKGKS